MPSNLRAARPISQIRILIIQQSWFVNSFYVASSQYRAGANPLAAMCFFL